VRKKFVQRGRSCRIEESTESIAMLKLTVTNWIRHVMRQHKHCSRLELSGINASAPAYAVPNGLVLVCREIAADGSDALLISRYASGRENAGLFPSR
jgi:hypothetical protein